MAQVINTNSLSLVAQNNLNRSQSALGSAIERLSSGLRINSAKDDAAGQAISNRFTANINGLSQASRNANDGISIAQTTEGALNEINDNLQNIRRLTVQAENGTNSASDRQSIQDEINQRIAEINRISEQTEFNGVRVLDGSTNKLTIQVGANDGQTIDIDLAEISSKTLSITDFNVNGYNGKLSAAALKDSTGTAVESTDITIKQGDKTLTGATLKQDEKGNYYATATVDGKEVTYAVDKKDIAITDGKGSETKPTATITIKDDAETVAQRTESSLKVIDSALAKVDSLRSGLGAVQNRFDSVINNLNSSVNNLSASRSRILDADYATEVSNMSRAQILQQAGTSVLGQANAVPQGVLSLL